MDIIKKVQQDKGRIIIPGISRYKFELIVVFLLLIYVLLCLSPSSYGLVLSLFGFAGEGLMWGEPRTITSDEWVVWTPYFQAVVNNEFGRYNMHSIYGEDFRVFFAFPVNDWGIIFKPTLWSFFLIHEAYAFSLHHALTIMLFIIGWKQLLEQLIPETKLFLISALFSLLLFFSGFAQGWWTTYSPLLAMTPWLFLVTIWCAEISWWKGMLFFYVSVCWILSHLYPPVIISSAYFGIVIIAAFKPKVFNYKTVGILTLFGVLAMLVVFLYLRESIAIMSETIYPGKRISHGGQVDWKLWISTFLPYINHSNYNAFPPYNFCELGVVTSYLPLMVLFFTSLTSWKLLDKRICLIFIVALIGMSIWMLAPFPAWLSKWTLLDRVPGKRMLWAFGLTLQFLAVYVLIHAQVRINLIRTLLFSLTLFVIYLAASLWHGISIGSKSYIELFAGPATIAFFLLIKYKRMEPRIQVAGLVMIAMFINLIYFGFFNPGQSAKPIFDLKDRANLQMFKQEQSDHPKGWVAVNGYPGSVLQGLKIPSITHTLMMPQLDFFSEFFPDMPPEEFNRVFNRYAHIILGDTDVPRILQTDMVVLPQHVFHPKYERKQILIESINISSNKILSGGHIDHVDIENDYIKIEGWGLFIDDPILYLNTPHPVQAHFARMNRPDVVMAMKDDRLHFSGFVLTLKREDMDLSRNFCLYIEDKEMGLFRLHGKLNTPFECN